MINFVLKYTGSYGLLAILAVAIITPTYFFFARQQEQLSQPSAEKQDVNKEMFQIRKDQLKKLRKMETNLLKNQKKRKSPIRGTNRQMKRLRAY